MRFDEAQRRRLRTSNMCENLNRQIKRRTRVAGLFPNEKSVLLLRYDHLQLRILGLY
jgi:putative transposase